jgi:hypothetical protein
MIHPLRIATVFCVLACGLGCGGGGVAPLGGGGGGGGASATLTISNNVNGKFGLAMSTSFQPAEWDYTFFQDFPGATTTLGNLQPHHVRLQGISQGVPQTSTATWDFSILDAITQPVLGVGDHSPEFQIAKAPAYMYGGGNSGNSFLDTTFAQFAGYTQNLVKYYNIAGGFVAPDGPHASPAGLPITWWGIYNEPNINNNLTPQQYVQMYNTVVPAMQAVDPSLKFAAIELADFSGQASAWIPPFVSGVNAEVDVMATHFYSSCNQKDSDEQVFSTVPGFASDVQFFYSQMASNPALASVPLWVTENNVNADFDAGAGISACNGTPFVTDLRGSSAFFAAWRPYVFSQLGKARVQALYITGISEQMLNSERSTLQTDRYSSAIGWITGWGGCSPRLRGRICCSTRRRTTLIWKSCRC